MAKKSPKKQSKSREDEQGIAMKYSFFKQQAETAVKELDSLNMAIADLATAKIVLEDVKKAKEGEDVLIPIGGNAFINVSVKDVKKVLVGVGADVVMQKPIEEALDTLNENLDKLGKREKTVIDQVQSAEKELQKLAPDVKKIQERALKK